MFLRYWSRVSADGECALSITKQAMLTPAGRRYGERHTWVIDGQLQADTPVLIAVAVRNLEATFARDYGDAELLISAGVAMHRLPNAGSTTGVRVVQPPHYPQGTGAEGTTFRNYRVVLEAEYLTDTPPQMKVFSERLSQDGGLPLYADVVLTEGLPRTHLLATHTPYRYVQSGQAVGFLAYPPVPPPVFGRGPQLRGQRVEYGSPIPQNGGFTDWAVSWAYEFSSPVPLTGLPFVWNGD